MKARYEVCVVKENKVIVYMMAYTKKQAKGYRALLRRQYPDDAVQIFELEDDYA